MENQNTENQEIANQNTESKDVVKKPEAEKLTRASVIVLVSLFIGIGTLIYLLSNTNESEYKGTSSDYSVTPKSTVTGEQAYIIACDLIKDQVSTVYPDNDFPLLDYKYDDIKFETYIIVSYFTYKVDGVERKYNYKAKVQFNGGEWSNKNNWTLHYTERYNN